MQSRPSKVASWMSTSAPWEYRTKRSLGRQSPENVTLNLLQILIYPQTRMILTCDHFHTIASYEILEIICHEACTYPVEHVITNAHDKWQCLTGTHSKLQHLQFPAIFLRIPIVYHKCLTVEYHSTWRGARGSWSRGRHTPLLSEYEPYNMRVNIRLPSFSDGPPTSKKPLLSKINLPAIDGSTSL